MTRPDALHLLGLSESATPEEVEARYRESKDALEAKLSRAPTPGLQAKYREALGGLSTAYAVLRANGGEGAPGLSREDALLSLGLPPEASPERIATRVSELEATLGEKIARAVTPGLKARYEQALVEARAAGRILQPEVPPGEGRASAGALAATNLPVLRPQQASARATVMVEPAGSSPVSHPGEEAREHRRPRWLVPALALLTLCAAGAGGVWWKTTTDAAESLRLTEENALREKHARIAAMRARRAEAQVRLDALGGRLKSAREKLATLKIGPSAAGAPDSPEARAQTALIAAHATWCDHLDDFLSRHESARQVAGLDALLASEEPEPAAKAAEALETSLTAAEKSLDARKSELLTLTAPWRLDGEPAGLAVTITDAYGRTSAATLPVAGEFPLGPLKAIVTRPGWPAQTVETRLVRGDNAPGKVAFPTGGLGLTSTPAGLDFELSNNHGFRATGKTPATLDTVPVGEVSLRVTPPPGFADYRTNPIMKPGETVAVAARFPTGKLKLTSDPDGLAYTVKNERGLSRTGKTPATEDGVPTGPVTVGFAAPEDIPAKTSAVTVVENTEAAAGVVYEFGRLNLTSEPTGAEVWLGDKRLGVTPFVKNFSAGALSLTLKAVKHADSPVAITLPRGRETSQAVSLKKLDFPTAPDAYEIASIGLKLAYIPPGTFSMGDRYNTPVHQVTLSQGFWMGATEVTQTQYEAIIGANPSGARKPEHPVWNVTWENARDFCVKLTEREKAAGRLPEGYVYGLPTEAQWEYACRAGTTGDFSGDGNPDNMAWHLKNSGAHMQFTGMDYDPIHPVAKKSPNAFGLFDMHGNVEEWCLDSYATYSAGAASDPATINSGPVHVTRGGSFKSGPTGNILDSEIKCSSAARNRPPYNHYTGFRLALRPIIRAD